VHMTHGTHAIGIVRGRTVSGLEIGFGALQTRRHHAGARLAGQRDECDRALAGGNRLRGMAEMDDVGAAAGLGGVDVTRLEAEIVDHRPQAPLRIARAEIAVDVLVRQARILERALGDFGMQLRDGFVRRMPGRVFVDAGDICLALDAQTSLRLVFRPSSVFCDLSRQPWQATTFHAADVNFTERNGCNTAGSFYASD
jgi:hypothetical protein